MTIGFMAVIRLTNVCYPRNTNVHHVRTGWPLVTNFFRSQIQTLWFFLSRRPEFYAYLTIGSMTGRWWVKTKTQELQYFVKWNYIFSSTGSPTTHLYLLFPLISQPIKFITVTTQHNITTMAPRHYNAPTSRYRFVVRGCCVMYL